MNSMFHLCSVVQSVGGLDHRAPTSRTALHSPVLGASTLSLLFPLLIGAGVVALLMVALLVWMWRRRYDRPSRLSLPVEAPELADLRTAETTEDVRFCVELARSVGGPVLELGSGTGRIALELARR